MILKGLEPARVLYYFEEISSIPRGSGNLAGITEYLTRFAKEHNLEYSLDNGGNLLIRKPASAGYERAQGVILQGHMDMVCVKAEHKLIDMEKESISLCTDGEKIWADGTTLGADDGIAVAYILAVLESDKIPHPPLEALITADEEVGLLGASAFDTSQLLGTRLINLDSEDEGVLTVSCAGGVRALCKVPVEYVKAEGSAFRLIINGLKGGHSGIEIDKGRINAVKLLARTLNHFAEGIHVNLVSVKGGVKENAIPSDACAELCVDEKYSEALIYEFTRYSRLLKKELAASEPEFEMYLRQAEPPKQMYSDESTAAVISALYHSPDGVIKMDTEIKGMVKTSLNLGLLYSEAEAVCFKYSVRSSSETEKEELMAKLSSFMRLVGGSAEFMAKYPAWEYRRESPLREAAIKAFQTVYRQKPVVTSIHAGLECGIFAGSKPDLDCISFGPDLKNVHSPEEYMMIDSVSRTWNFLLEILKIST